MGIAEDITSFEQSLNELVMKYEQYFLGMEKREPLPLLAEVERAARTYQNTPIINTMMKFKYNSLVARLNSYKQYWGRITRLIEEGKYSRDRFKMEMHQQMGGAKPSAPQSEKSTGSDVDKIYRQYVEARRSCNLPVDSVTPEMIASVIERQKPALINKYGCRSVEFKVVIEDGKPKIKVRPVISSH
jgi:hypothetical protein